MTNIKIELDYEHCTGTLLEPLTLQVDKVKVTVPKDFQTDFASIPKLFWSFLSPIDRYTRAAIVHDWLYIYHKVIRTTDTKESTITRKEADDIFYKLMGRDKVPDWKRKILWSAVRLFGYPAWK